MSELEARLPALWQFLATQIAELSSDTVSLTALLVFIAETGDKSQLVCTTLAARYQGLPVIIGAALAFVVLNMLAVLLGAGLAESVSEVLLSSLAGLLFLLFAFHTLVLNNEDSDNLKETPVVSTHSVISTVFLMIFLAEFGDKTQIAVAGLSAEYHATSVWMGATLALIATTIIAVWLGKRVLQRIPVALLQRITGLIFLVLGCAAAFNAIEVYISTHRFSLLS